MFDFAGNHNESVEGIINGHTEHGTNGTTNSKKKVHIEIYNIFVYVY